MFYVLQYLPMEQRVSLREVNQRLTRYVKAAEAGERIVITRRGKPVALLSPLPRREEDLDPARQEALERILGQSHHLGGRAASRDELHER
jgi:prevent-host-death family protein